MPSPMSMAQVLALPVVLKLEEAGAVFGLGRTKSYELWRQDAFPCEVQRVGRRLVVTRGAILTGLGVDGQGNPVAVSPNQPAQAVA